MGVRSWICSASGCFMPHNVPIPAHGRWRKSQILGYTILDYAENKELCRRQRLQAYLIAQALDAPCQPVNQLMASMLVKVGRS
jgi:hypothetical protein